MSSAATEQHPFADITVRDDELLVPDARLSEQIAGLLHEGVMVVLETGRVAWCNDTACRLLGLTRDQLQWQAPLGADWQAVRLDGTPVPREEHPGMRALATDEPVRGSLMGIRINGRGPIWMLVDSTPTTIGDARVALTVFTDVTKKIDERRNFERTMDGIRRTVIQTQLPRSGPAYFTCRQRSVGPSRLIGGDFCGAHQIDEHRYAFFIGDACGHGVQAANLSALANHTMRSAMTLLDDPREVLSHVHEVVAAEQPDTYLTAICGYVDVGDRPTVRMSSGGHPLPVLVRGDLVASIGEPGPIVGMVPDVDRPLSCIETEPGDQLLLYTDGLISTRHREVDAVDLVRSLPRRLAIDMLADLVVGLAEPATRSGADDDVTVLAIRFR